LESIAAIDFTFGVMILTSFCYTTGILCHAHYWFRQGKCGVYCV